jgi:hypothetical protein
MVYTYRGITATTGTSIQGDSMKDRRDCKARRTNPTGMDTGEVRGMGDHGSTSSVW